MKQTFKNIAIFILSIMVGAVITQYLTLIYGDQWALILIRRSFELIKPLLFKIKSIINNVVHYLQQL